MRLQLPRLLVAGFCTGSCATLLGVSTWFFAKHCADLLDDIAGLAGRPRRRKHGSRKGLPSLEELGKTKCCDRECLLLFTAADISAQFEEWRSAETRDSQIELLLTHLIDRTTGRLSGRCAASCETGSLSLTCFVLRT